MTMLLQSPAGNADASALCFAQSRCRANAISQCCRVSQTCKPNNTMTHMQKGTHCACWPLLSPIWPVPHAQSPTSSSIHAHARNAHAWSPTSSSLCGSRAKTCTPSSARGSHTKTHTLLETHARSKTHKSTHAGKQPQHSMNIVFSPKQKVGRAWSGPPGLRFFFKKKKGKMGRSCPFRNNSAREFLGSLHMQKYSRQAPPNL